MEGNANVVQPGSDKRIEILHIREVLPVGYELVHECAVAAVTDKRGEVNGESGLSAGEYHEQIAAVSHFVDHGYAVGKADVGVAFGVGAETAILVASASDLYVSGICHQVALPVGGNGVNSHCVEESRYVSGGPGHESFSEQRSQEAMCEHPAPGMAKRRVSLAVILDRSVREVTYTHGGMPVDAISIMSGKVARRAASTNGNTTGMRGTALVLAYSKV